MEDAVHSLAPEHLPAFLPGADGSDFLFTAVVVVLIGVVLLFGVIYFSLHALPEKIAHGTSSTNFQLICVLALLAMFTHNNLYWIAALLLATVQLPDFTTPLKSIARSLEELKNREPAPLELSGAMSVSPPEPAAPEAPAPEAPAAATIDEPEEPDEPEDRKEAGGDRPEAGPG